MKKTRKIYISLIMAIVLVIALIGAFFYTKKLRENNFFFAIQEGDITKVKEYLKNNVDVNSVRTKSGSTALHVAAMKNRLEIAKLLINSGLDPNAKRSSDSTPLIFAIQKNNYQMVKLFLDNGVPATQKVSRHMPAIHCAAQWGHVDIIKLLIERGANVNRTYWQDVTPLCKAVSADHLEAVKLLLKLGAKIDKKALLFASQKKDKTILKFLQGIATGSVHFK